jgi:hypothetical protein
MVELRNVSTMSDSIPAGHVSIHDVSPTPTDAEVVAIMAGVEALWPKPMVSVEETRRRSHAWRFSGRWWSRPVPARRDRPFR